MLIHLFRHGIAIDREDPSCPAEAERFLTKDGLKRTRAAARGLAALELGVECVLTSPFVRARQTAEIAAEELGLAAPRVTDALLWDASPTLLRTELAAMHDTSSVLCAGHAPHLDFLIGELVGASVPITRLKKAGLASIDASLEHSRPGLLVAIYPPRALRALGKR